MMELPKSLQKNATSRYEVFLNRKNYGNEIDLETVLDTFEVMQHLLTAELQYAVSVCVVSDCLH